MEKLSNKEIIKCVAGSINEEDSKVEAMRKLRTATGLCKELHIKPSESIFDKKGRRR